jgi:outer membrane protein assembly factor BamE (lipoprotein component of BamABCDE complex)
MMKRNGSLLALAVGFMVLVLSGTVYAQVTRKGHAYSVPAANEPLYSDYKGVRVGMTAEEVHKKLGEPSQRVDDQEFYIVSDKETVQICYDKSLTVCTISIDYLAIVGDHIDIRPDGSMWELVRYEKAGFWVSYNRTAGASPTTTVTIQKMTK